MLRPSVSTDDSFSSNPAFGEPPARLVGKGILVNGRTDQSQFPIGTCKAESTTRYFTGTFPPCFSSSPNRWRASNIVGN